jgi:amidohydrolase
MAASHFGGQLSAQVIQEAIAWRHHLHRHPELAYQEHRTSDFVASLLEQWGLCVHRGLAGTGVVGTLKRGTGRRAIGIRADMDALPIAENASVPYVSEVPHRMHACGHDGHVAIALAAARACAAMTDLDGTVHFIFQPAEENEKGAQRMLEDGLFTHFPCDSIYALHNWPALPVGVCVALDGPVMAALGLFEIVISGLGCHGAMPHEGTDVLVAGCQMVSALQTIVSRNVDPRRAAVLSVTQLRAGDTWNVIPETCLLRGTTRWFDNDVGDILERRLTEVATAVASALGCSAQISYERRIPATINDPGVARFVRSLASSISPTLSFEDVAPSTSSEDFSYMLQVTPGCYVLLGAARSGANPGLHSEHYDFNDDALQLGVQLWVTIVRATLARQ